MDKTSSYQKAVNSPLCCYFCVMSSVVMAIRQRWIHDSQRSYELVSVAMNTTHAHTRTNLNDKTVETRVSLKKSAASCSYFWSLSQLSVGSHWFLAERGPEPLEKWRLEILIAIICMEREREREGLHFKRRRLHLCDHLSVFLAFGLVNGFDFLRGSLLLYSCMRKQQGSAEVTQIRQHISKCHTVASRTRISGFRNICTEMLKAQFTQNTEPRQNKWLVRGDDVFMWFDLDTKEVNGSYKVAPVSRAWKHIFTSIMLT